MTQAGSPPQSTQDHVVVTRSTTDLVKAAVSGWMGTAMEFMDFQLYSLAAAIVFNKIFFPNVSPAIGLIAAMATYGVGYVARLVGAIYFGRMGDRIGRKKVLFITIALMGGSTTLIGVLPTYEAIGILAPILLVALRLIQGFGAGAEIAGATVMLAEYAPVKRRGLVASLVIRRRRVFVRVGPGPEPGRTVVSVGGLAKDDDEGMPDEITAVLTALEGTR